MEHTPESQPQQTAQEAFEQDYQEILDVLAAIKNKVNEYHNDGRPKNWSDVGSLGHVTEELNNIAEFLGA